MSYNNFTDMPVWQLAFDLLLKIYSTTKTFPSDERFGLVSDMRRSANSITHNIAEGFGRYRAKDKSRFYKISRGSAYELISQVLVSSALSYLSNKTKTNITQSINKIIKELNALIKTLES